jgi:hypothetical protein
LILSGGTALSNPGSISIIRETASRSPYSPFAARIHLPALGAFAGTFTGNESDLDAGNGYLTVTSAANQTLKRSR